MDDHHEHRMLSNPRNSINYLSFGNFRPLSIHFFVIHKFKFDPVVRALLNGEALVNY